MTQHYFDHASTSPMRPETKAAYLSAIEKNLGDPSRIHAPGLEARVTVEHAREQVAHFLGARPREVIFTSGATEAIASAVWGVQTKGTHQVLAALEHSAVREQAARHSRTTLVGVNNLGRVDPEELVAAVVPGETALVHLQLANHEVGTLQPVREVIDWCKEHKVLVHVDAAQAIGRIPFSFHELGADLVSVSAHKFGGPPGMGALLVRRGLRLTPLLLGGDQERARRAGAENTPGIAAFGATAETLSSGEVMSQEATKNTLFRNQILKAVETIPRVEVFGDPEHHLDHLICLGISDVEPQPILIGLDRVNISVHSGSSCSSEALEPSPVLEAMGVDAQHSLRISLGWSTTQADVDALCAALPKVVSELRQLRATL
ncbi:MAG: cysteine desulfurase family protein [Acidimicrobiia bacterium]